LVIVPPSKTLAPPRAVAFPAAELTSTLLPVSRTFVSVPLILPPPDEANAAPTEFVIVAALPEMVVSVIVAPETAPTLMPPAKAPVHPGCRSASNWRGWRCCR
jgi:hypothetical protein